MNRATAAVLLAVTIFGLTYGLSAPLIALRLAAQGYSEALIGVNAAMHALGVLLIAPFLPWFYRYFSPRGLLMGALVAAASLLTFFPLLPVWCSFLLRLLLGMATELILVVTETWLNQQSPDRQRAKTLATYTAVLSLGFALGPVVLSVQGTGSGAFVTAASLALLAALSLTRTPLSGLQRHTDTQRSFTGWLGIMPLALAATLLNAALETAGMNLLAVYAMNLGWPEAEATSLIAILLFGAIVLQLPVGWLADRIERRRLVVVLAALSTLGALAWPLALQHPWLARALLFCWGGAFVGIYTVILTLIGQCFQGTALAGAYAALSVAWGLGALAGPMLGGIAMSLTPQGLPWLAALLCAAFTLFAALRRKPDSI